MNSPEIIELRLHVAGQGTISLAAFASLKRICATHRAGQDQTEGIDLRKMPALAAADQSLVVHTLARWLPEASKKIIGGLCNEERVLGGLDLQPAKPVSLS